MKSDIDAFFDEYVVGFMAGDIRREIDLARSGAGGGNFLAALGLLSYTEFLGGLLRNKLVEGESRRNFDAFFVTLGPEYRSFAKSLNVYKVFRCGMAHEYFVKHTCVIAMLRGRERCGLGRLNDECYYFDVEHYCDDFTGAAARLRDELKTREPEPDLGQGQFGPISPSRSGSSVQVLRPDYGAQIDSFLPLRGGSGRRAE